MHSPRNARFAARSGIHKTPPSPPTLKTKTHQTRRRALPRLLRNLSRTGDARRAEQVG